MNVSNTISCAHNSGVTKSCRLDSGVVMHGAIAMTPIVNRTQPACKVLPLNSRRKMIWHVKAALVRERVQGEDRAVAGMARPQAKRLRAQCGAGSAGHSVPVRAAKAGG